MMVPDMNHAMLNQLIKQLDSKINPNTGFNNNYKRYNNNYKNRQNLFVRKAKVDDADNLQNNQRQKPFYNNRGNYNNNRYHNNRGNNYTNNYNPNYNRHNHKNRNSEYYRTNSENYDNMEQLTLDA